MSRMNLTNEECSIQAVQARKRGEYELAARWWNTANARTLGHKKGRRFEKWADAMMAEHGLTYTGSRYADDEDAV